MTEAGRLARWAALLAYVLLTLQPGWAATRESDVKVLNELSQAWFRSSDQLKSNWTGDPCDSSWTGVVCDSGKTTVTQVVLDSRGLVGSIPPAIGNLSGLQVLELSDNSGLGGQLPEEIGNLPNLRSLSIQYCSLKGILPSSIGNLRQLAFLGVNGNSLSGTIPAELGQLNLTWMDISNNYFSGEIPLARNSANSIGLDNITTIVHFHFNNNSLEGGVPAEFFGMPDVLHVLLDHNKLNGSLPTVSNFSQSLQIVRLDVNQLTGEVPSAFLTSPSIIDLNLQGNQLSGTLPNASALYNLSFLDLSDNKFDPTALPTWLTSLQQMATLNLANLSLSGEIPPELFDLPNIEKIDLSGNQLNGTLAFSGTTGPNLVDVDLGGNSISGFSGQPSDASNVSLSLFGNPICSYSFVRLTACAQNSGTFAHPPTKGGCSGDGRCSGGREYNPNTCRCAYPLDLQIVLTVPTFYNLNEEAPKLEKNLASAQNLALNDTQVYVYDMKYTPDSRVNVFLWIFPETGDSLDRSVGDSITFRLRNQLVHLPEGPYVLPSSAYAAGSHHHGLSTSSIVGIAIGCVAGFLVVALSVLLAVYHKRRADKALMSNPFASWGGGSAEFGEAPKLKGARWFSLAELKAYTNNWSDDNQVGVGGYGKVYKGTLPNGDLIAIKRATEGSLQGANEFKNEIELLSRVHHRNLLGLVGFCYEGGEQALVYEFMSNGTLYDHLKGGMDVPLSWAWRLEIALASARGLAYLHDHASPPIIHRDIKSQNILLNEKLVAKVADFGLSKLAPDEGEKSVYSLTVKGTLGYLDPEYYMTQNLTDKSDVYSFGVVLLEILTARPPIVGNSYVVRDFRTALDKGGVQALRALLDPSLVEVREKELEAYLAIAMVCVNEDGTSRPAMAEIVKELEMLNGPESGMRAMDIEGAGKKVKFADNGSESDQAELLRNKSPQDRRYQRATDSFQYSGDFGGSTTVRPK